MHELWQHCRPGRPTILVGAPVPPAPDDVATLRVVCSRRRDPLGIWLEAGAEARRGLGLAPREGDAAVAMGARGALLGEREVDPLGDVIADLNRLFAWRPYHLILDRVDAIDPRSLQALERILRRPGWLRPALVLGFAGEPEARFARLIEQATALDGALLTALPPAPVVVLPGELPPASRRILRAAAVIGEAVEVDLLAALVECSPLAALEALQDAADAGVHLDDDGAGLLHLDPALIATLREGTLPSLRRIWHRRLAELLGPAPAPEAPAPASPEPDRVELVDELPADLATPGWAEGAAPIADPVAQHLLAAGDAAAAVERLLVATDEALAIGATAEALALADQARAQLERQPPTSRARQQQIALLTLVAQAQYHAVGPRHSLAAASATADAAAALLRDDDPPPLRARLDTLRARILYDQGSPAALEAALTVLTDCSRWLEEHGAPREAARLFNDQAAIWVRIGDVVRAHHLLEASRAVFARHAESDPTARLELAETDHLIARLPLHVEARPGRADDAIAMGVEHGAAAAKAYAALGMPWEEARVWETLGRLELARGARAAALEQLRRTAQRQQQLGDALGLGATVQALAEAMAAAGQPDEAIELLRDSLALNAEKGSARGLARVTESLEAFVAALSPAARAALTEPIGALQADLALALGRLSR